MVVSPGLTRRERVILAHLALPLTLSEIAEVLFVTRNTVKSQVRSIYLKLDVSDRESALAVGRDRGLVPADLLVSRRPADATPQVELPRQSAQMSTR